MRIAVELTWEPNQETDLAGYKVSWGKGKELLLQRDVTKIQLSLLLAPKQAHTFSVQAFDMAGNISEKRTLKVVYLDG